MPSFSDSAVIFLLALLLLGPKKLPELARYIGKLMGEFRRASSEFRLQMEDEFRTMEQVEQQKKIAAMEAAAPVAPLNIAEPEHPHLPKPLVEEAENLHEVVEQPPVRTLPIASEGELQMMPPATGLPVGRSNGASFLSPLLNAIPHGAEPMPTLPTMPTPAEPEATQHG